MAQDIEEFLRMAAARKKQRAGQQAPQNQPQPQQPPQQVHQPPQQFQQQQFQQPPQQYQQQYSQQQPQAPAQRQSEPDIYIVDDEQPQQRERLKSSIKTSISTDDVYEHASHLGEGIGDRSEATDDRVHKKFDHSLGSLAKKDIEAPKTVNHGTGVENRPNISQVIEMLKNPGSLKNAIILKEIFDRPKF